MFSSLRSHSAPAQAALSAPERPLMANLWFSHESVWMRRIARIVLATWLLPLLLTILTLANLSAPAQAQSNAQTVVVLDFGVAPGIDPLLGRKAADGLAVELQRSQDYEIIPRQRVEEAVAQQAGLQPPFNDTAQIRLAQALNATSVFSGRVVAVNVNPGRSATVTIEVRQLDAATGDYVNGTQVVEPAEQRLQPIANEILVDEAINKASFSAVRSMRQTSLPVGKVLNTTVDDLELSIGARNGVGLGQRYSVLRDVYNRGKNVTERVKIAEITISRVEDDQSVGRLAAGGAAGVRTGDYIRQIFVPGYYPVSTASANGGSITPVTAPPALRRNSTGIAKSGLGKGLLGIVGLAAIVGLAGFGGGGAGGTPSTSNIRESDPDEFYPQPTMRIRAGFGGINVSNSLRTESIIAYFVYRGTSPNFNPNVANLQAVLDARTANSSGYIDYTDPGGTGATSESVSITAATTSDTGTGGQGGAAICGIGLTSCITIDRSFTSPPAADSFTQELQALNVTFTPQRFTIGQTYYYKVQRLTAERVRSASSDTGDTGNSDDNATTVNILPILSNASTTTDGYTPLFRPEIETNINGFSVDNLVVEISADTANFFSNNYTFSFNDGVGKGVDFFRVQLSRTSAFDKATTVTSAEIPNPAPNSGTNVVLQAGEFNIPPLVVNGQQQQYQPGVDRLYLRVLARNTNDAEKRLDFLRRSSFISFIETVDSNSNSVSTDSSNSRFVTSDRKGSLGLSRVQGVARTAGTGAYSSRRILKPR